MKLRIATIFLGLAVLTIVGCAVAWGWYFHFRYRAVNLDKISFPFNADLGQTEDLPDEIRVLDGKNVYIEGEIFPVIERDGVSQSKFWVFAWSYANSNNPNLYFGSQQTVDCAMKPGKGVGYTNANRIRVYGKLHVNVERVTGGYRMFTLDVDRVNPITAAIDPFPRWPLEVSGVSLITLALAGWILIRNMRQKSFRRKNGLCSVCGFDLRESTDRCPECGTAFVAAPIA